MTRKTVLTTGLIIAALLLAARIALPSVVTWYVNRSLDRIPGYEAAIDSIDLNLYRGAYLIHGIRVHKLGGRIPLPLIEIKHAFLSIHWRALLEGKFVGRIDIDGGSLNFVNGRGPEEQQLTVQREWLQVVKDLLPLRINHFAINDFDIRYRDPRTTPIVDVKISHVRVEGRDFSNTRSPTLGKEARLFGIGLVEDVAPVMVKATLSPRSKLPTFDLNVSVERLPLTTLNDLFKAHGSFDVERGSGDFYLWLQVQDARLKGTLKPLIHNIEIFEPQRENESLLTGLWESLVGAAAGIFENKQERQIGTVLPLEGDLRQVEGSTWTAIVEIVRNALFEALRPGITKEEKGKE
jgi:hypothetical protein